MKWVFSITYLLVIVTGCSANSDTGTNSNFEHEQKMVVEERSDMPQEMPDDFDFIVSFGYGEHTKNEIDTFEDTVTKDLIINGSATANLIFTLDEMQSIYEKMREINIMDMKGLAPNELNCSQVPYNEDTWEISVDGKSNTLTWSDKHCDISKDAKELLELRLFVQHIVEEKDTYKQLPKAKGGYD